MEKNTHSKIIGYTLWMFGFLDAPILLEGKLLLVK
jgi:hypothetical protein